MAAPHQEVMNSGSESQEEEHQDVNANLCCPSALSCVLSSVPCFLPAWLGSIRVIDQNEHAAVLCWGKYVGSITQPGITVVNPFGVELRKVSTQQQTLDIKDLKCTDGRGSPVIVSGNIVYRVTSAKKSMVDVQDARNYLREQAPMVLRKVCSKYPYECHSGGVSLRGTGPDHELVPRDLARSLEEVVTDAGICVLKFDLTDLSYAPEIAAAMLQKQQAEAMVEARQVVVQSAVDISSSAIKRMKALGHTITPAGEERIIGNLLTVICGDRGATPTINM